MLNFKEQNRQYLACIEEFLEKQCFTYVNQPQTELFDAMRYSLLAGGKRLRPIFVSGLLNVIPSLFVF